MEPMRKDDYYKHAELHADENYEKVLAGLGKFSREE